MITERVLEKRKSSKATTNTTQTLINNMMLESLDFYNNRDKSKDVRILYKRNGGIEYKKVEGFIVLEVYGELFAMISNYNTALDYLQYFDYNTLYNRDIVNEFFDFFYQSIEHVVTYNEV